MNASCIPNHLILSIWYFDYNVVVSTIQHISASDSITEAEALAAKYRNTTPTLLDVTQSEEKLNKLIQQHDVVIR